MRVDRCVPPLGPRPLDRRTGAVRSALLTLATAAALPAQPLIGGLVVGTDGQPIANARATLWPLHADDPLAPPQRGANRPTAAGTTTARGDLRLAADQPGALLVIDAAGGRGALVLAAPGAPLRIEAGALATVETGADTAVIGQLGPGPGQRVWLGHHPTPLRLPPGRYQLAVESGDSLQLAHVRLEAGARATVPAHSISHLLRLPAGFDGEATAPAWPGLVLPVHDDAVRLAAEGPLRVRCRWPNSGWELWTDHWLEPGAHLRAAPPADLQWRPVAIRDPAGPVPGASLTSLRLGGDGTRLIARSRTGADGFARGATDADLWVARAAGSGRRGLLVADAGGLDRGPPVLELGPGHGVTVRVRDPAGHPVAGAPVSLVHKSLPELPWRGSSDARGIVRFDEVPAGSGTLLLRSADHVPAERAIAIEPRAAGHRWTLTADPGAVLRGVVVREGAPAGGVTVTLREASGALRQSPRAMESDASGRFAFSGLLLDEVYTVSASWQRGARTWSAQLRGVQPGDGEWTLELIDEDPVPPQRRGGRAPGQ